MRTYQGNRNAGEHNGEVLVNVNGTAAPLAMRCDIRKHAEAYAWGSADAATSQLALAMCADALGDDTRALNVHGIFARTALLGLNVDQWEMNRDTVCELVADLEQALTDAPAADEPAEAELEPLNGEGADDFARAMNPQATVAPKPRQAEQSQQSTSDPVSAINDAKTKVVAAVKARGYSEEEMLLGGLAASWRAAQALVEAGLTSRDPDLMAYGLHEMTVQFSRALSLATSSGGKYDMTSDRVIEVSECISRETGKAAKAVLRGIRGASNG